MVSGVRPGRGRGRGRAKACTTFESSIWITPYQAKTAAGLAPAAANPHRSRCDYQLAPLQPPLAVPPLVEQLRVLVPSLFFVIVKVLPEREVAVTW